LKTILRLFAILSILLAANGAFAAAQTLRFGITPAMARNQYALLEDWRDYLARQLDRKVEFVFCDNYLDSLDLMKQQKLDFAWLSAPAYLESMQQTDLLATPVYQGKTYDHAYLIVPSTDKSTRSLLDLKGKIFAYVDSASNTGYLASRFQLQLAKQDPDQFFRKTFFTHDHLKAIAAVAIGLADGGTVSGFVWDTLTLSRQDITGETRIVAKSGPYGFPPVVARHTLNKNDFAQMQNALLNMSKNKEGIALLRRINLDGFTSADSRLYHGVYQMMKRAGEL
jgi:phosphonate transport system substrate-binding protein